jgi:hypothetical protein
MSLLRCVLAALAVVHTSAVAAATGLTPAIITALSDAAVKAYAAGVAAGSAVTGAAATGAATGAVTVTGGATAGGVCAGTAPVCAAIAATLVATTAIIVTDPILCTTSWCTEDTFVIVYGDTVNEQLVSINTITGVSGYFFPTLCPTTRNIWVAGKYIIPEFLDPGCIRYTLPKNEQVAKNPFVYEGYVEDVCFQVTSNKVNIKQRDGWDDNRNKNGETLVAYYWAWTTPSTILRDPVLEGWNRAVDKHVFSGRSLSDMREMVDNPSLVPTKKVEDSLVDYLKIRLNTFGYVLDGSPPLVVRNCRSD